MRLGEEPAFLSPGKTAELPGIRVMEVLMNVLLIEDNDGVARSFSRLLSRKGHVVTHALGIGDALDQMAAHQTGKKEKFDLVITDRDVIGGDAWELVAQAVTLGQLPNKVIFMSGTPPEEPREPFFHKGADDPAKLLTLIENAASAA